MNQVQPVVVVAPEVTKNEENEATVYGDIEGTKLEYVWKVRVHLVTFESNDLQWLFMTLHETFWPIIEAILNELCIIQFFTTVCHGSPGYNHDKMHKIVISLKATVNNYCMTHLIIPSSCPVNVNSWFKEIPDTKEVLNGLDPVQNEQTDEVIEELKSELSRRQSAVPGAMAGPSVVITEPEPESDPEPEPEPAINPYAIGDDDIPPPDY